MTTSLSELIERLERAEAGSRDLDFAIAVAAQPFRVKVRRDEDIEARYDALPIEGSKSGAFYEVPPFTTSLDAALSLMPEGLAWVVSKQDGNPFAACGPVDRTGWVAWSEDNRAATPAIALCIAALKARQAGEG